ncbi:hypothetical protein MNBD_ALPHA11-736 [hydrothermal vent metagenome]|uniref:Uncharacterized protein n=1 Tax=hydrothermal vent metagenome TaxID=652676 RepID=A0A3B0TGB8_9ZZZZ
MFAAPALFAGFNAATLLRPETESGEKLNKSLSSPDHISVTRKL